MKNVERKPPPKKFGTKNYENLYKTWASHGHEFSDHTILEVMQCTLEVNFIWNIGTYLSDYTASHPRELCYENNFSGQGHKNHWKISFKTESVS
jgi:hypothetical protein